jgi:hypothetical protein
LCESTFLQNVGHSHGCENLKSYTVNKEIQKSSIVTATPTTNYRKMSPKLRIRIELIGAVKIRVYICKHRQQKMLRSLNCSVTSASNIMNQKYRIFAKPSILIFCLHLSCDQRPLEHCVKDSSPVGRAMYNGSFLYILCISHRH